MSSFWVFMTFKILSRCPR